MSLQAVSHASEHLKGWRSRPQPHAAVVLVKPTIWRRKEGESEAQGKLGEFM